jgi:hypothetical protein
MTQTGHVARLEMRELGMPVGHGEPPDQRTEKKAEHCHPPLRAISDSIALSDAGEARDMPSCSPSLLRGFRSHEWVGESTGGPRGSSHLSNLPGNGYRTSRDGDFQSRWSIQ